MAETEYKYDVFISYSSANKDWVRKDLLSALEIAGLRACIDFRDFKPGKPSIKNIRDSILESRHTLLVMTEPYLKSGWTEFENILSQTIDPTNREGRIIPLLKEKCDLPLEIKYLTYVNFFDPDDWDMAWKQLLDALGAPVNFANKIIEPPRALSMLRYTRSKISSFVGHQPADLDIQEWHAIMERIHDASDSPLYFVEQATDFQNPLLEVAQSIFLARHCIFDVSIPNPNTYIELGIALAFNKPILLLAQRDPVLPEMLRGYPIVRYESLRDLEGQLDNILASKVYEDDNPRYCPFCNQVCEWLSVPIGSDTFLFLNRRGLLWSSIKDIVHETFRKHGLRSGDAARISSVTPLCNAHQKAFSSGLVILNIGEPLNDAESFLTFGMSVGSATPWILIARNGTEIPSLLNHTSRIEYEDLTDLQIALDIKIGAYLNSSSDPMRDTKIDMEGAFWIDLDAWLDYAGGHKSYGGFEGEAVLVQYERKNPINRIPIPVKGLLLGRDEGCNVVLRNDAISRRHCRITRSRKRYYIQDHNSDLGTYVNGQKLDPKQLIELHLGDYVRLHEHKFRVWDNRPLPETEVSVHTGRLNLYKIDIPDLDPPLSNNSYPADYTTYLQIRLFPEKEEKTFEIKEYYPFGRILAVLAPFFHVPEAEYCLSWNYRPLDPNESMTTMQRKWDTPIVLIRFTTLVTQVLAELMIEHTDLQPHISEGSYLTFRRNVSRDVIEQNIVFIQKGPITRRLLNAAAEYRTDQVKEARQIEAGARTRGVKVTSSSSSTPKVIVVTLDEISDDLRSEAVARDITLQHFDEFIRYLKNQPK
ncbi:MAG: TIR domain-containing protein [Chloroflexota bacterium]